jgi:hypothetical protein
MQGFSKQDEQHQETYAITFILQSSASSQDESLASMGSVHVVVEFKLSYVYKYIII